MPVYKSVTKSVFFIFLFMLAIPVITQPVLATSSSNIHNIETCYISLFDSNCITTIDSDGDGLSNTQESTIGTSITSADTDNDGYTDLYEYTHPERSPVHPESKTYDSNNNGIKDHLDYQLGIFLHTDYSEKEDTDNDGLSNLEENILGTNPNKKDTDNDGYNDEVEIIEPGPLSDMDPLYKDVVLELDSLSQNNSTHSNPSSFSEKINISNPSGETGFRIHKISSDTDLLELNQSPSLYQLEKNRQKLQRKHHDYEEYGSIQVVFVDSLQEENNKYAGWIFYDSRLFFISRKSSSAVTYIHEFGHLAGIIEENSDTYAVDTDRYSYDEYPSVMNYNYEYNSGSTYPMFSDGTNGPKDHNDIEDLQNYFDSQDHQINQTYTEKDES